jgi:predicted  nucleic acid-binding Zn-ribbon protein
MSVASRLYQLQTTEQKLKEQKQLLKGVITRLERNDELATAQSELAGLQALRDDKRKAQRQLEWEVEELTGKIRGVNDQLYGGSVRNPKELVNLEQEIKSLKRHLGDKEGLLLEAMDATETAEEEANRVGADVARIEAAWDEEKPQLQQVKSDAQAAIEQLVQARDSLRAEIGPANTALYDSILRTKGLAVVKVEQGRCKGCNITVPSGQWQTARGGEVVMCGSCGRILFVE